MKYQKYLIELLRNSSIDSGNIHEASKAVLQAFVKAMYLKDGSIWLLDDNGSMVCSFILDMHEKSINHFSAMDEMQVKILFQELGSNAYLVLNSKQATSAYWVSNVDLINHSVIYTPIYHKGSIVGFLQGRRQNHQAGFDEKSIPFTSALANLFGRAILATQNNKLQHALKNANLDLQQTVLKRNQELKKTLEDLQTAQGHLVESEKMAALGQLVCGVAHEVNTPLGVAITSLSILGEEIHKLKTSYDSGTLDEPTFMSFIEHALSAHDIAEVNMRRAATLIHEFKQTSADQSHRVLVTLELKTLIDSIIASLTPIYEPHQVEFVLDIPDALYVTTYSESIDQILTNLVNNTCIHGFQASNQRHNLIFIKVFVQGKDFVIDYQDNGVGISDSIAKNIFTPFFTTNRSNGGSGLGLSVIYNLVSQKLAGEIRVIEQDASLGAHFQIRLPITLTEEFN
ncbi:sensor histidine kinase [Marinomonas balearica]|uniref:histidine kinase n=1 Tax=Marinomonas balearica TaxID=491947 RepID=A0A4R6ME03_9GAMM|nr:HAMP domain-containing sensor histidine kinase [Marinomonas balearica]TDO99445.1 GAF sensor signal transduction histidine kinase [Marinomonas balearica]